MRFFRRRIRILGVVLVPACLLASPLAFADHVDDASAKIIELEGRLNDLDHRLKPPEDEKGQLAERRLIDAEVAYELKNYEAASIILYDIIEKYPTSSVYAEALYYLSDSLYLKRDYFSSRRYFEKLVTIGPASGKYQEALERLVELSLHTGDYEPVDGYLQKLAQLPSGQQLPSVPYVAGKYRYFRRQFGEAVATLQIMRPDNKYYLNGLYFIGAANVALGKDHLSAALSAFDTIIKAQPVPPPTAQAQPDPKGKKKKKPDTKVDAPTGPQLSDADKIVVELAHLGRARILMDSGKLPEALAEYATLRAGSNNFPDALYESAWVSIKGKDYQKAARQLDLLLLNSPDSTLAPEVRLLTGNLDIRQNHFGEATESFTKTRDEYEPLSKELAASVSANGDPIAYFRDVINRNLSKFDLAKVVPQSAVKWMKADQDTQKLRDLLTDESDLGASLTDAEDIIKRLERAINGPGRVNVFPELARAKTQGVQISNALVEQKKVLGARERQLMEPVAGADSPALKQLEDERAKLEDQLRQLPTKDESIADRQKKAREAFNVIDGHANEVQVELLGARAQLTATNKFFHDGVEQTLPAEQQRAARAELELRMAELDKEQADIDALRHDIADSSSSVGADDADMRAGEQVKAQYSDLLRRQHLLLQQVETRMGPTERGKAEQIQGVLARAEAIEEHLGVYNRRIDALVEEKLVPIRATIDEEKARVGGYRGLLTGYDGESAEVGGGVLATGLRGVAQRFYNVVVRADVGIIDVAWALKDSATKESNRLISERKRELKLLDDEFKDVLKDSQ